MIIHKNILYNVPRDLIYTLIDPQPAPIGRGRIGPMKQGGTYDSEQTDT